MFDCRSGLNLSLEGVDGLIKHQTAFDQASRYRKQLQDALGGFFPLLSDIKIEQTWTGPSDRSVTGFPVGLL